MILKDVDSGAAPADIAEAMRAFASEQVARTAGIIARSLRAADREDEAKLVEDEARKQGIEPKLEDRA